MIRAEGLYKDYGEVHALRGVDLVVEQGTLLGLLGRNGAGKTTLVDVLATVQPPTAGRAEVAGRDVVADPEGVRERIGVTGQYTAVDEALPGRDNIVLVARLYGAGRRQAAARADELLEAFGLTHAGHRDVRTYSGGMRRRLDLALGIVARPTVLFLDEPTTGLDPTSRANLWETVAELTASGTTVLLTTQYLEEADRLADRIVLLGDGCVVASGTPAELKARLGTASISISFADRSAADAAASAMRAAGHTLRGPGEDRSQVTVAATSSSDLVRVVRILDRAGLDPSGLSYDEPSLDDVYLTLAADGAPATAVAS